ncbi:MAG: hypothetical protein MUO63_20975 [Desulfobulbaceae bacterium]|nr:hypothetical protein [Desulfobulbaceae bacterium]
MKSGIFTGLVTSFFVLSCLSLLQPENHHKQELFILGQVIGLSGYLYSQMFPVRDKITI